MTLIGPEDTWTLWAVMIAGTGSAVWLEQTYRWAAKVSAPLLALLLAMLLSNAGIMPRQAPAYDFVGDYLVPLALPLLLFRANLFRILRTTGWMFAAFHLSAAGTVAGAFLATLALRNHIVGIEQAAGLMTGSYVGGGVNFFAVKESLQVDESLANPLLVADNFVMAGMFALLLIIASSRFFLRHFRHPHSLASDSQSARNLAAEHWRRKDIGLLDLAGAMAFAFAAVALAELLRRWLAAHLEFAADAGPAWQVARALLTNRYVLITSISLALATGLHRPLHAVNGPEEIGGYLLYIFLFAIGLPADLAAVIWQVPLLFVFCGIIALTNLAVTLALGRLCGFGLEELLLCVNATLGGAPTAAAMAIARGWSDLVLPAILVGIWGYAIGTLVGVSVAEILLRL